MNFSIIKINVGIPQIVSKETFQKAKEMMVSRKKAPGANKAKELYLLTGLIFCGCCGSAMQGNRRNAKDKPKYVSYRCGCRLQKRACDNKEIRKEYVEEFVLSELEKHILNDKAIPVIVNKINAYQEEQVSKSKDSVETILKELDELKKQIENIVKAIANGFFQDEFKSKMEELQDRKYKLEIQLTELKSKEQATSITEEQVRRLFSLFKEYVIERNIPECKKFIQNYVDKVTVYKDHIEVIFNVVFDCAPSMGVSLSVKVRYGG